MTPEPALRKLQVAQVGAGGHRHLAGVPVIGEPARVGAGRVPQEDPPRHRAAVGVVAGVQPGAHAALGDVQRPPRGLGPVRVVGGEVVGVVLRREGSVFSDGHPFILSRPRCGTPARRRGRQNAAMELREVMTTTPATREFSDEPLPDAILYAILDQARFAPNGGNRQAWHVIVVRDRGSQAAPRRAVGAGAARRPGLLRRRAGALRGV